MIPPNPLIKSTTFTLNTSGVAGFFGGEVAVSAMATVHVYKYRKWLGWYNTPGSHTIAIRYGQLANSRFWDGLFPGADDDPAVMFGLDGKVGPKYHGIHSGTIIPQTSHLGYLFASHCEGLVPTTVEGRGKTLAMGVTIADLSHVPPTEDNPKLIRCSAVTIAAIPILVSFGTCAVCGIFKDWWCFSMILLGIIANGLACYVIGSAQLSFVRPQEAPGVPNGNGLMWKNNEVIVLIGKEGAVNAITRGKFSLNFRSEPEYWDVGFCSVLLTIQFLLQLLLIPQGTLLGQLMFLASIIFSWGYNSWLSSFDKEQVQRDMLIKEVFREPKIRKYKLGTRTAMVVFALLALDAPEPRKLLDELLPNDTKVWRAWKKTILSRLENKEELHFDQHNWELADFTKDETKLLETLYGDAASAYNGYLIHLDPKSSSAQWASDTHSNV